MTHPQKIRLFPSAAAAMLAAAALSLFATGCPNEGVLCSEGLTACGNKTCEDLQNDPQNCGQCGVACGVGEVCQAGDCICAPGAQECGGACVVVGTNPDHCGACGNACGDMEVCQAGMCQAACTGTATLCGRSCVDVESDAQNCGACGNACAQGQSCNSGTCTYDVIAACSTNGEVRGVQADTYVFSTLQPLGTYPQALATYANELLFAIDGFDNRLYQANLTTLSQLPGSQAIGSVPNDILVSGEYVFVTNSGSGTLLALRVTGAADGGTTMDAGTVADAGTEDAGTQMDAGTDEDAGTDVDAGSVADAGFWAGGSLLNMHSPQFPAGAQFEVADELQFGDNTFPQVMVQVGNKLYVTLYGGTSAATAGAGQKVVEVDITNPANLTTGTVWDLTTLPLMAFMDGGTTLPRPQGITERAGMLYVALNNLDTFYSVAGPAYLATLPLDGGAGGLIELPQDKCLNAVWTQAAGDHVVVSCAGQSDYSNFPIVTTTESGLALINANNEVASAIEVSCPAGGDAGCASVSLSRFGVVGQNVYVGDQAAGRLFVVGIENGQLVERRTYSAGQPLNVCPVNMTTGYSNVGDVLSVP